jgi:glutathione S-transferase
MIVVHHLNNSRSQRVVWLLEELGASYRIQQWQRDPKTNLAPPELKAVHPLGKSPVIQDGDLLLSESGAIIEYLVERHGAGKLTPPRGTDEHVRYLQWLHFAEGTLMLHLIASMYLGRVIEQPHPLPTRVDGMVAGELDFVEAELARSAHLAGSEFSAADVQMAFALEFAAFLGHVSDRHERVREYIGRMQARPAYRRAVNKAGPYAFDPQSAPSAAPFPKPAR